MQHTLRIKYSTDTRIKFSGTLFSVRLIAYISHDKLSKDFVNFQYFNKQG